MSSAKMLVIQRGHVARRTGATGAPGEQAMAIRNAAEIVAFARDMPDVTPKIIDADEPNHRYSGDFFISLHGDGSADTSIQGASVGYRNDAGRYFAQRWKTLYEAAGWPYGFRSDNYTTNLSRYYGTGHAISAGVAGPIIVEHGFMTNPASRKFIESDQGVMIAAATALVTFFPNYDLDTLLQRAPRPDPLPKVDDAPPSTAVSSTVITIGDTGADVLAWQRDLMSYLPKDRDAHRPDGHFGPRTARWTARAMVKLGLVRTAPNRPLVGPNTRAAMRAALRRSPGGSASWQGKAVRAKVDLNFYDSPRWSRPVGVMPAGHRFPRIEDKIAVGGGHQYRVRNSRGQGPFYVTAASRYVDLV